MSGLFVALRWALTVVSLLAVVYVAVYHLLQLLMIASAWREVRRGLKRRRRAVASATAASGELPGISVLVPAYNEAASICRTVETLLAQRHPDIEVVVVSDGSTDRTLALLRDRYDLFLAGDVPPAGPIPTQAVRAVLRSRADPRLVVVDKRNGGKADALNVGINAASRPLVCVVDADVVLDPWALVHLAYPFVEDAATVASSGTIRLQNGCRVEGGRVTEVDLPEAPVEAIQVLEYVRAFGIGRLFFNARNAHVLISGAFGLFDRSVLVEVGGFQPNAIGEDMELVLRIHRHLAPRRAYRIAYVGDALCFTEGPHSMSELGRQRTRWHQGLLTSLRLHAGLVFRPGLGAAGMLALPYFLVFELLSPVVETVGWLLIPVAVAAGLLPPATLLAFLAASVLLGATVSLVAVALDDLALGLFPRFGQLLTLAAWSVLEQFGYHQATLYYRLRAFPRYYRAIHLKSGWVSPARQGRAAR